MADTDYSFAIPLGAKKFTVKARGGIIKIAVNDIDDRLWLADGQAWNEDNLDVTGQLEANAYEAIGLIIQSPTAGAIAEIIYWK